ncbi:hypothetical protein [Arthrobacter pascens]|uniref:hypothetical protein n=1 Tax=Arthrobacter pascens TaxID=1677 RepID=UPI00196B0F11|nr:hypothetical protein [Arthrobacter pascens]MBN3498602.1 hypothetical protein [Arthrobacter pascens]
MTTTQASLNTLTIEGVLITKDIAKQLDELRFEHRDRFQAIGRIRSGIDHGNPGIELIGKDNATGALVRMWHLTKPLWTPRYQDNKFLPPEGDGLDDVRQTLTDAYNRLQLIVLPKDGRP